jgi:hypothetical protein
MRVLVTVHVFIVCVSVCIAHITFVHLFIYFHVSMYDQEDEDTSAWTRHKNSFPTAAGLYNAR